MKLKSSTDIADELVPKKPTTAPRVVNLTSGVPSLEAEAQRLDFEAKAARLAADELATAAGARRGAMNRLLEKRKLLLDLIAKNEQRRATHVNFVQQRDERIETYFSTAGDIPHSLHRFFDINGGDNLHLLNAESFLPHFDKALAKLAGQLRAQDAEIVARAKAENLEDMLPPELLAGSIIA